jgi:hypothetical protein
MSRIFGTGCLAKHALPLLGGRAKRLLADGERSLEERLGFGSAALGAKQLS